ncbi:hypothetical protein [Flammeovirga pacifica]|uniref:Preprotein translocase subunit SecB n=1 Tax=Flammeovirga pacifica TaxID=915059 RepID=A0A1S1YVU2_FLAPC|nr:hypothetical protein [Flammeovirga pacifica]OHX65137.1 hypothetical protein NH26_01590 [Flammeovirga pacifica]
MENRNIPFRFAKIETDEFATIEGNFDESNETLGVENGYDFGFNADDKAVAFTYKLTLLQEQQPFLILKVTGFFEIEPKAWENQIEQKEQYIFPVNLLQHLLTLVVGTTRGIMHTKVSEQPYRDFVLPTVNVTEMINEDFVFDKE